MHRPVLQISARRLLLYCSRRYVYEIVMGQKILDEYGDKRKPENCHKSCSGYLVLHLQSRRRLMASPFLCRPKNDILQSTSVQTGRPYEVKFLLGRMLRACRKAFCCCVYEHLMSSRASVFSVGLSIVRNFLHANGNGQMLGPLCAYRYGCISHKHTEHTDIVYLEYQFSSFQFYAFNEMSWGLQG